MLGDMGRWREDVSHACPFAGIIQIKFGQYNLRTAGTTPSNSLLIGEGRKDEIPAEHLPCVDDLS